MNTPFALQDQLINTPRNTYRVLQLFGAAVAVGGGYFLIKKRIKKLLDTIHQYSYQPEPGGTGLNAIRKDIYIPILIITYSLISHSCAQPPTPVPQPSSIEIDSSSTVLLDEDPSPMSISELYELVQVENLSPVNFDNESYLHARYWDVTLNNKDTVDHKVSMLFRWEENATDIHGVTTTQEGSIGGWDYKRDVVYIVPASSTQNNHVVVEDPYAWGIIYSNGKNLRADILSIDEVPIHPLSEVWNNIEVEIKQIPDQPGRCVIEITNNDFLPHSFKGKVLVQYSYDYRGEIFDKKLDYSLHNVIRVPSGESDRSPDAWSLNIPCGMNAPNLLPSGKNLISLNIGPVTLEIVDPPYCEICGPPTTSGPTKEFEIHNCEVCN